MKGRVTLLLSLVVLMLVGCNNERISNDNDSAIKVDTYTDKEPLEDNTEESEGEKEPVQDNTEENVGDKEGQSGDVVVDHTGDEQKESYKPEYLEIFHIDDGEKQETILESLERYNHGYFVSYNPETRELVLNVQKWICINPEDDPEEKYPSGYRLEELGEETFILAEDCEMWLFVEGSSYMERGKVDLQELPEMIESGYTEYLLMVIYKDGEEVQCLYQQYEP